MCQKLATLQVDLRQVHLPRWCRAGTSGGAIRRSFFFEDFGQACGFMAQVSNKARELEHKVTWTNCGGAVELMLSSEEVSGLSDHDLALARFADEAFNQRLLSVGKRL